MRNSAHQNLTGILDCGIFGFFEKISDMSSPMTVDNSTVSSACERPRGQRNWFPVCLCGRKCWLKTHCKHKIWWCPPASPAIFLASCALERRIWRQPRFSSVDLGRDVRQLVASSVLNTLHLSEQLEMQS